MLGMTASIHHLLGMLNSHTNCVPCRAMPCRALLCVLLLQRRRNATRLCEHIVSGQCLQQKLPEACIAELLAAQSASESSKTTTIAVAVSVAVGGGLLWVDSWLSQLVSSHLSWRCVRM